MTDKPPDFHSPSEMDDDTLAVAWEIVDQGRQFDGVEERRREIGREMCRRLRSNDV